MQNFSKPDVGSMESVKESEYTHRLTFSLSSPRNDFKLCRKQKFSISIYKNLEKSDILVE